MADFLDRLLARSVPGFPLPQGETVVAPRLPQLFEQGGAALDVEEFVAAASTPAVTTAARPPIPATPREDAQREIRQASPSPVAAVPARTPATAAIPVVPPSLITSSERVTTTVEAHSERVREEHFTTIDHTVYQGEPAATLLPSTTVVVPATAAGTPEARRHGVTATRRGEPPQSMVRVSIGRVEVTGAAKPEKPPARPKPTRADPAMSLERYLAGEGGRR
jgi:hypothetical protein